VPASYPEITSVLRLLVTPNVPSSPILVIRMMEAIRSSEMLVLTRVARRNIPEDGILRSHRRENLISYKPILHGLLGISVYYYYYYYY
jgi:hypothetical protein